MASSDLQSFLQDRLVALDPGIDVSAGSPAQTKFISPVLDYLGTDPFETDIPTFILDRLQQEFPELYAADPGALKDLFIKPLQLLLEPIKREIQTVRRNQSLIDPSLLSDDDADALVANVFDSRDRGGLSSGTVRAYFPNPTDVRVEVANRVYSKSNLTFFPTGAVSISAELMSFNREGGLFYMDIPVRAEKAGAEYNLEAGEIAGIDGIPNLVRAANLRKFSGGSERQDNDTFVSAAETSLTERSLTNRRGAIARLNTVFKGQLRGIQVVGAKDPEMQRDLLVATGPGHSWITGPVSLYRNVALVLARTVEGSLSSIPSAGDTLYFYLYDSVGNVYSSVSQEDRLIRLRVEELLVTGASTAPEFQQAYFVRWSDPDAALGRVLGLGLSTFTSSLPKTFEGGFAKRATIKVSSLPDTTAPVSVEVPSGGVHVFGHSDIYIRPTIQSVTKTVLDGAYDLGKLGSTTAAPHFSEERLSLTTTAGSIAVGDADPAFNFVTAGAQPGDVLSIESGPDAGLFVVGAVSSSALSLSRAMTSTGTARYRLMRSIRINPFAPRIPRFPFGDVEQLDLNTSIGSALVTTSTNNLLTFGAKVGDVLEILDGPDVGAYLIESFDPTLGGQGINLNKAMTSTSFNLRFAVYTSLKEVQRPLVRVREILLLDSAGQSTGLTIPPADPAAVVPVGPMTSAKVLASSQLSSGFVLPDLAGLLVNTPGGGPLGNQAASSGDRRYSLGFDTPDGTYISTMFLESELGGVVSRAELDLRSDTSGKTSFFLATVESSNDAVNYPPAEPKPGECLSIKSGPNKGDYLVKAVHKFKYTIGVGDSLKTYYLYFIQIYGTFPVDPFKELITFLQANGVPTGLEVTPASFPLRFPFFFTDFYNGLGGRLATALTAAGVTATADLDSMIQTMCSCFYECGVPARGVLRTYYREPTLFEEVTGTADEVTTFSFQTATGESVRYRPDPVRYLKHEVIPPRLDEDAQPTAYPTDLEPAALVPVASTASFQVGDWAVGASSRATGKVAAVEGSALVLRPVFNAFSNGETISSSSGGSSTTVNAAPTSYSTLLATDATKPTFFLAGVKSGDVISVHEEISVLGPTSQTRNLILQTSAGSPIVTAPEPLADGPFTSALTGSLLFIEDGDDVGGYRVTRVVDARTLVLDRTLTSTTPPVSKSGIGSTLVSGLLTSAELQTGVASTFTVSDIGSYLTLYGIDYRWIGSFPITAVGGGGANATVTLPTHVEAGEAQILTSVRWALTAAPASPPATVSRGEVAPGLTPKGTDSVAGVLFRVYESTPTELTVSAVTASTSVSSLTVQGPGPTVGVRQPYRVFRRNTRRITPAEMRTRQEGFLFYFDTEVVSLSPADTANIPADTYLMPDPGTFTSIGYRHVVSDPNFSYSMKEEGFIDLPLHVMADRSADSPDSLVRVIGAPIQIAYEKADLVSVVQDFADSASDRLVAANVLVRHFLPAYLSYDATYQGGAEPSVISGDIRKYLDQIPVETPVDVSEIEKVITGRGGNPDSPTQVAATIYDWDRKMWVEFSKDTLGGPGSASTKVPYNGSPRVTFFLPGPDVSGQDPLPTGERINLTRR